MVEVSQANRPRQIVILARHGRTQANAERKARVLRDGPVQGFSKELPLDAVGERQAESLGRALSSFIARHNLNITAVHVSDSVRGAQTRDRALGTAGLGHVLVMPPDARLGEMSKGNLEGMMRSQAYPTEEIERRQAIDWHFRHGTKSSGGETPFEAGSRWLDWFDETTQINSGHDNTKCIPAVVAFGHDLVTSYGLWLLTHPGGPTTSLEDTLPLRTQNGTAQVVVESHGAWDIAPKRIVPMA